MLTQDTCKTKNLGNKSEMAKAKRIENAIKFWSNQTSFKLSPVKVISKFVHERYFLNFIFVFVFKDLSEKINQENMDLFPIEMRKALASGIVHTIRSTASANKRRQLQAIFSDENISIPGSVATAAVVEEGNQSTSASISFSQSAEQTQ